MKEVTLEIILLKNGIQFWPAPHLVN